MQRKSHTRARGRAAFDVVEFAWQTTEKTVNIFFSNVEHFLIKKKKSVKCRIPTLRHS
jgi:hypothetical protein